MASFDETTGRLTTIQTPDLIETLDALDSDEVINMNNRRACLGVRTIERLIDNDRTEVRFGVWAGTVEEAEAETYTVTATESAGQFIESMIDRQLNGHRDAEVFGITVAALREALDEHIDRLVDEHDWQVAL